MQLQNQLQPSRIRCSYESKLGDGAEVGGHCKFKVLFRCVKNGFLILNLWKSHVINPHTKFLFILLFRTQFPKPLPYCKWEHIYLAYWKTVKNQIILSANYFSVLIFCISLLSDDKTGLKQWVSVVLFTHELRHKMMDWCYETKIFFSPKSFFVKGWIEICVCISQQLRVVTQ